MSGSSQEGLTARSWLVLIVYAVQLGFVIKGIKIALPLFLSRFIRSTLVKLRLAEPRRRPTPGSRTESTVGITDSARQSSTEVGVGADGEMEVPPKDEVKHEDGRIRLALDLRTAPVTGVIFLLITTGIDGSVVRLGLVGEDGVRPYDVLVLFISLAYISTALDSTGALRSLAFYISQRAARVPKLSPPSADRLASGPRLYALFYFFWFLGGVIVGNDPIILSGTAFLGYFTRVTGIADPTAWTFSQFIAANVASSVLVSSNPTNVLIAGAFGLNFLTGYTAYTILPSVIAALVAFPLTYSAFTLLKPPSKDTSQHHTIPEYIPSHLLPPDVAPKSVLIDPAGATFHTTLMLVTLATLVGTSFVAGGKVEVWMVTAPAGLIGLGRDLYCEWSGATPPTPPSAEVELDTLPRPPTTIANGHTSAARLSLPSLVRRFTRRFPTTSSTISRLPLSLLLFAGGIFVLARALTSVGWTSIFAHWLATICTSVPATIFFLGYFSAFVMCPLCGTNIGCTILLVEILRDPHFSQAPHVLANPKILQGAIFSTALASNLGACSWTFSSSLAGLLWVSILRQKGIKVKALSFAKWNLAFLPILSTVASLVIWMEIEYFST